MPWRRRWASARARSGSPLRRAGPDRADVPKAPWWSYRDEGWSGWSHFLHRNEAAAQRTRAGERTPPRVPRAPLAVAGAFARSLDLRSAAEWFAYCKGARPDLPRRPDAVPANPYACYRAKGWTTWPDFLGTACVPARLFPAGRTFARSLGLRSRREWEAFCRGERPDLGVRPRDIPARPDQRYADEGWQGWTDWLGT